MAGNLAPPLTEHTADHRLCASKASRRSSSAWMPSGQRAPLLDRSTAARPTLGERAHRRGVRRAAPPSPRPLMTAAAPCAERERGESRTARRREAVGGVDAEPGERRAREKRSSLQGHRIWTGGRSWRLAGSGGAAGLGPGKGRNGPRVWGDSAGCWVLIPRSSRTTVGCHPTAQGRPATLGPD